MVKYEIREICGDWSIWQRYETDQWNEEKLLLVLNSRSNAEYVRAILEYEARYLNAAAPYSPKVADMSDEEVMAIFRLCTDKENNSCPVCPLWRLDACYEFIYARFIAIVDRVLGDKHE